MDDQELQKLLIELQQEIGRTKNVGEKEKGLLREVEADIQGLLERAGGVISPPHPSTIQRLEDSIEHLEITHPNLTEMMSKLLSILSNIGI
jgi:hypothetical protein